MLTLFKKNAIPLLLGIILGGIFASGPLIYYHNQSTKRKQSVHERSLKNQALAYDRVLNEKNKLLNECIKKHSAAITNEFSPNIDKNKKGNIVINTTPDINNNLKYNAKKRNTTKPKKVEEPPVFEFPNFDSYEEFEEFEEIEEIPEPPKKIIHPKKKHKSKGNWK